MLQRFNTFSGVHHEETDWAIRQNQTKNNTAKLSIFILWRKYIPHYTIGQVLIVNGSELISRQSQTIEFNWQFD